MKKIADKYGIESEECAKELSNILNKELHKTLKKGKVATKEICELLEIATTHCNICGKKIIPDKKAVRFGTKEWNKHTFKYNCDCFPNIRISSG